MAKVLLTVAEGSEEIELCTPLDILRRAGAEVTVGKVPISPADATNLCVKLSHGLIITADAHIDAIINNPWDR